MDIVIEFLCGIAVLLIIWLVIEFVHKHQDKKQAKKELENLRCCGFEEDDFEWIPEQSFVVETIPKPKNKTIKKTAKKASKKKSKK